MAQERSRWSTLSRRKLALLSLISSAAAISLLVASTRMSCNTNEKELDCGKSSQVVIIFVHVGRCFGVVFITIFLVSGSALIVITCNKKIGEKNSREAAASDIPTEDLDNSAAPTLPYFPPFVDASSTQLPDYFTAVQNIPEVSSQPNEELWTEDIDGSDDENEKPPCYEQALTMSGLTGFSASEADLENQAE